MSFVHLHVHSQYSILDGAASVEKLVDKAIAYGHPAVSLTDHGNMFGVKEFFSYIKKYNKSDKAKETGTIKPIIGCEVYVAKADRKLKDKEHKGYYHLILLAKNMTGYHNLMKLVSLGYIEGMYYKPRIDHEILAMYHEGLICCSACIAGEIPRLILDENLEKAEEAVLWHRELFGEDYYLEVQLHKTEVPGQSLEVYEKQSKVNAEIFRIAEKYGIKVVATNDVHFADKEDGPAHDRLICLTTNTDYNAQDRLRYTQQEYFKSEEEMAALFPGHPEVISNTLDVAEKVEYYDIDSGHILPIFPIPDEFPDSDEYLRHLTYKGAEKRYPDMPVETKERIDFELETIKRMGFPDYFLIVQDFIMEAKRRGVSVGPGRGSAAGSAVAYCLGITNVDPIKYQLLFERFLNPDRISMPDIDIDFDDDGRYKVFRYVEEKYGKDHISHVVTFGTMAAKSAIKDIARIHQLPLAEANRLAKLVPDKPFDVTEMVEKDVEEDNPDLPGEKRKVRKKVKEVNSKKPTLANCVKYLPEFKAEMESPDPLIRDTLKYAVQLEGTVRQTGVHACAMIIGRDDLTKYIPISIAPDKDTGQDVWVSQYEGSFIEEVGMLKMDFLGLKTLSIIKECLSNIKKSKGEEFDIEQIPIDDEETYKLYSRGDTTSVFQFESPGMKKWLKELVPNRFEDLIAMNALYRPGPMDYIPSFVARKHGKEAISYDLPDMEEYLEDTYGVTVYQEQVMLLSQKLAGFTKGQADRLRKAMGKKKKDEMDKLYGLFISGGIEKGHPENILKKIWADWEKFAQYAFNKSHATCYAWVSYQTAYLKAHYPAEFQAANLSKQLGNIDEIKKIMEDCKRSRIQVLGPDINESEIRFTVNREGAVRFGLGGVKGFGEKAVEMILRERENGPFADIYDFMERIPRGLLNIKTFEYLLLSGTFDSLGITRAQYYVPSGKDECFIDSLLKYADLYKRGEEAGAVSLFWDSDAMKPPKPPVPAMPHEQNEDYFRNMEKELVGMYLSSHPLDRYAFEVSAFATNTLDEIDPLVEESNSNPKLEGCAISVAGYVTGFTSMVSSVSNKPWCKFVIEDFDGSKEFALFGKDYETFGSKVQLHNTVLVEGNILPRYYVDKKDPKAKKPENTFKIKKISLLGNVSEERVKNLTIEVATDMITPDFRKNLVSVLKKHKGKNRFVLKLVDRESEYVVDFFSKKYAVSVNMSLLDELRGMKVPYKVVTQ